MSVAELADTGLPFNRKERYFTGTVFPMLVCAQDFAHLGRLTDLCGLGGLNIDARPASANVQLFTEYGFAESVIGDDAVRFAGAPMGRDTPDVIVYFAGPPRALLAIEAKMFDRPSAGELRAQLAAQATIVQFVTARLDIDPARVAHVALLPAALARSIRTLPCPTLTWETLLATFADVAPPYFVEVLRVALTRYDRLVSPRGGANAEQVRAGADLVTAHRNGTLTTPWMGRRGGLHGAELARDVATGGWQTQRYECSSKPVGNPNWFAVADFAARVEAAGAVRG